jgi:subtilisin family serine protease
MGEIVIMENTCSPHSHFDGGNYHLNLAHRLRLTVALCLIFMLGTSTFLRGSVTARQETSTPDVETLLATKADPLLQTIRRATLRNRPDASTGLLYDMGHNSLKDSVGSEIVSLSRIAGVQSLPDGATRLSLTVTLATDSVTELNAAGFAVGALIGRIATIETDIEKVPALAALNSVSKITAATRSYPNNDLARRSIGIDDASGQRVVSGTGRGVIVAIIDDGIDFRHLDFTLPGTNGQRTRIKALLDMTVYNPQAPPLAPDPGWNYTLPGLSSPIGHLYTEADINSALGGGATIQQRNRTGHGTHVAGTAAGNGLAGPAPGKYAGMAPEADLIIVKASRQNDGTDNFLDADQINALAFIQQKASALGEPFAINMSMAGHFGPHDGTRANERAIDSIVNGGAGRAVCISGGSTGDMHAHASGSIPSNGDLALQLNVRDSTQLLWLSYANADTLTMRVTRPDGVQSTVVAYNPNQTPGFSNQYMDIYNTLDDKRDADPQNDQKAIIVLLKPGATALGPAPHTWTFTLHGDSITNGHFDAWASLEGDFINNIDDTRQTTIPGTARGGITVGGYVTRDGDRAVGDFASFTSPGPTADGRQKPDISAPAFSIYSSKAVGSIFFNAPLAPDSSSHVGAFGNSFAAPVVTGSVALLLQADPNLTSDQIKSLLASTATHDSFTGAGWNARFGFGKLNTAAALNALVRPTPTPTPAPTATPPPVGPATLELSANVYNINEGDAGGALHVTINRTGDASAAVSVDYGIRDLSGSVPCQTNTSGAASDRCDYASASGTVRFAAGDNIPKIIQIPIINDSYVEPAESFTISINNPHGAALGTATATATIVDNDTQSATINPINAQDFFIKQQYIDFLGRVAEPNGFQFWMNRMTNCPPGDSCDRVDTARRFFESDEFKERGFYVYKLYDATLGRFPLYAEFVPEVARLNGPQTVAEQRLGKDTYLLDFMAKAEFKALYDQYLTPDHLHTRDADSAAGFVDALCAKAGITPASRATLIANLQNGTRDPAHILEEFILTPEINGEGAKFYDRARIVMQYFGFLRRDPERGTSPPRGFDFWWERLTTPGSPQFHNYRLLVNDFLRADEYNFRFALISAP